MIRAALILSFFVFFTSISTAQEAQVSGKLVDEETQTPLGFVQVALFEQGDASRPVTYSDTDEGGNFSLTVKEGSYIFRAFFIGYKDFEINPLQVN